MMVFIARQEPFLCEHCGASVEPLPSGSYRNHCPNCLHSKHVDDAGPGDRESSCGGLMRPVMIEQSGKKGWLVTHVCNRCGKRIVNKLAPDDDMAVAARISAEAVT